MVSAICTRIESNFGLFTLGVTDTEYEGTVERGRIET